MKSNGKFFVQLANEINLIVCTSEFFRERLKETPKLIESTLC